MLLYILGANLMGILYTFYIEKNDTKKITGKLLLLKFEGRIILLHFILYLHKQMSKKAFRQFRFCRSTPLISINLEKAQSKQILKAEKYILKNDNNINIVHYL